MSASFSPGPIFGGLLVKIDVVDSLCDQFAERDQRLAGAERRSSRHVRTGRGQLIGRRRNYVRTSLSSADLAYASAVDSEVGGNIVLPVASRQHSFDNSNFCVAQSHLAPQYLSCNSGIIAPFRCGEKGASDVR